MPLTMQLSVFGIMITLCFVEPMTTEPGWVDRLNRKIDGTLYFASNGVNTSELLPSYTRSPFPADETADPPVAVLVARGASILSSAQSTQVSQLACCCIGKPERSLHRYRLCMVLFRL